MATKAPEAFKSRLVERLRLISRGVSSPIGFSRVSESAPPALMLVAVLPRNEVALAQAAIRAGATAVTFRVNGAQTDLLKETGDVAQEKAAIEEAIAAIG